MPVRIGINSYLFQRKRFARLRAAGGIANHCCEVTHQEDNRVTTVLKITQFLERDGVAKMEVGGRRIHPELDSEWPSLGQFRGQFGGGDYLGGVFRYLLEMGQMAPVRQIKIIRPS